VLFLANDGYLSITATIALLIGILGIDWNLTGHHLDVLLDLAFGAFIKVFSLTLPATLNPKPNPTFEPLSNGPLA